MRLARNPKLLMLSEGEPQEDRRRHGRLRCEQTSCCIGQIVDLSASGMLVKHRGRLMIENEQNLCVTVSHESGDSDVTVTVRVVRIERIGFRKHRYGLEFVDLQDGQKKQMVDLARTASDQLIFHCRCN
jgi:PilZ domain-containing protein